MTENYTQLVVPIRVSALCVGGPDAEVAHGQAPMADFSRLPYVVDGALHNRGPYTSTRVLSRAGPFEGAVALPAGIHLHWSLPAGLSHAVQTAPGGEMAFPPVPTRWVVTRHVVTAADGTDAVHSWVVESDRLSATSPAAPGMHPPTVPVDAQPGQGYQYLGWSWDLNAWHESGNTVPRWPRLTAVGYGEPTFASYYPNCSGVFGFYDDLSGVAYDPATQSISYYVGGWYGDPTADPLAGGDVAPGDNPFGWTWEPGDQAPTQTFCTGTVSGIVYDATRPYLGAEPGALTVAVGASPQEALSAVMADALARQHPDQDFTNAEALLNALQFGLLSRPPGPDALEEFEEAVHAAGFASLDAGTLWAVVAADGAPGDGDGAEGGEATLPADQGAQLDALNALQEQYDDLRREVAAKRGQLFVDWHKYLVVAYEPTLAPPELRTRLDAIRSYLQAQIDALNDLTAPHGGLDNFPGRIQAAADALAAVLDPSLRLVSDVTAPRFRRPADPVLVLSGPDVVPRGRAAEAVGSGGLLRCRTTAELVTQITVPAGVVLNNTAQSASLGSIAELGTVPPGFTLSTWNGPHQDAVSWTPALQPLVAAVLARYGGSTSPAVLSFGSTVGTLATSARMFVAGEPHSVTYQTAAGTAAPAPLSVAMTEWMDTPWTPLLLQYAVAFAPVHANDPSAEPNPYPADFLTGQFAFDGDSIDLVYGGGAPGEAESYAGGTVLSPGAATDLAGALRRWIAGTGSDDPRVAEALQAVETMPLLAQGMGGLGEELLMRRQTLQMAVGDPLAPTPLRPFVDAVSSAVGDRTSLSPLPQAAFNPLRAGTLAVRRLRLVDTFGQVREYLEPRTVVARGIAPPPGMQVASGTAFLPPRLTQPSRLLFRWLSTAGAAETTEQPATSPVFGWVVPNWLDRALGLYAADGTALGSLGLSADGRTVLWSPAPGGAFPLGTPMETVMAGQDPQLAALASALQQGGAAYLSPFLDAVREALAFSLPARFRESVGTAVLLGQPLALARATLTLSLSGPAARDESWPAFAAQVLGEAEDVSVAADAGVPQVRVPVALGAPAQLGDTLVGFWTAGTGGTDYGRFYAPSAAAWDGPVGPPSMDTVTVTPRDWSMPDVTVAMLLDPRGVVHATTGVLPVEAVSIPPQQYGDALRTMAVAFAAGPVLSGSNVPAEGDGPRPMSLVRPKVSEGAWSWVTVADGAWASTALTDAPTDAGTLSYSPQHVSDGWMVLTLPDPSSSPS